MNLTLSPAERTILEALDVSPDLPKIQVRATVVLRAGDGAEDQQIAAELQMPRKDVLHWRKRFEAHGIRGLWDVPGPGPKRRVSPEKERAIVEDALYALSGMNLDARLLALRHRLSRGAVYRVFKKYGIEFDRWGRVKIERLKVFLDVVTGELRFLGHDSTGEQHDLGLYWRYELWARRRHSEIDSTFVATGCIYAIRRTLAEPLAVDTLADDAVMPLRAFLRGQRVIFDPQPLHSITPQAGVEFRRRLRTLAGLWQVCIRMPKSHGGEPDAAPLFPFA